MSGVLQMGTSIGNKYKVSFMADPTLPNDATTKQYVDEFSNVNDENITLNKN